MSLLRLCPVAEGGPVRTGAMEAPCTTRRVRSGEGGLPLVAAKGRGMVGDLRFAMPSGCCCLAKFRAWGVISKRKSVLSSVCAPVCAHTHTHTSMFVVIASACTQTERQGPKGMCAYIVDTYMVDSYMTAW